MLPEAIFEARFRMYIHNKLRGLIKYND